LSGGGLLAATACCDCGETSDGGFLVWLLVESDEHMACRGRHDNVGGPIGDAGNTTGADGAA